MSTHKRSAQTRRGGLALAILSLSTACTDSPSADAGAVLSSGSELSVAAEDTVDDADGVFFPFMGYEYTNPFPCTGDDCPGECNSLGGNESCTAHGHKNVIYRNLETAPAERVSFLDPAVMNVNGLGCLGLNPDPYCGFDEYSVWAVDNNGLWDWLSNEGFGPANEGALPDVLTIIHTSGNIHHVDWDAIDSDFVRNVEIFSQWGNSEGSAPAGCANQDDIDVRLPPDAVNADEDLPHARPRGPALGLRPRPPSDGASRQRGGRRGDDGLRPDLVEPGLPRHRDLSIAPRAPKRR